MNRKFSCNVTWKFPDVVVSPRSEFVQNSTYPYNSEHLNRLVCSPERDLLYDLVHDDANDFDCIKGSVYAFGHPVIEFLELLNENLDAAVEGVKESYRDSHDIQSAQICDLDGILTMTKSDPLCMHYKPELNVSFDVIVEGNEPYEKLYPIGYSVIGVITALVRQKTFMQPNGVKIHVGE